MDSKALRNDVLITNAHINHYAAQAKQQWK